ncbi:class I SAM-dependent methyltransferase [Aureibacter tunicatorum]|uniref:Ubiquinone/menaquinone biosynthesis C-methylase UbiE n=1 Tax=Aureibacter tunicatorum TaxID=866807 RepID=A0AAE3XPK3_9BACT|nr:class I SAM-dependent methyltransferase [Aureibacter tunicatorum]MDR6239768.1 ubiquinone/menaquinone biosynthesis C-methylase UbiE [Aureibacter tunicatorum]BDD04243.1 putative methyltransferase YbaJ [Aureibacter tunicatorum]
MNINKHNSRAWDKEDGLEEWKQPFSHEVIKKAKRNIAEVLLTNSKSVPSDWYMPVKGKKILCLASGGGQQAPIFSAMGANVTLVDISANQLAKDKMVAEREGLAIDIIQHDMCDLSIFEDETFDMIFHPISNCFIEDPNLVWAECYRVLKKGGSLLSGFVNPILYLFDMDAIEQGELKVTNTIPYSDVEQLPKDQLKKRIENNDTLEYGHSLDTLIGGQIAVGFAVTGFYEDYSCDDTLDKYIHSSIATKALKV